MTAIFTGFNPTKPACDPIPNPKLPKNKPRTLDAKDAPAITTSVIGALSSSGIGAPSFIGAESIANISAPSNLGAESKVVISAPVSKTAESKAPVSTPSSKTAQTAITIPAPSEKAAQAKASVDTPSNLGAENAATVSAPSSKSAQAKATISAPSNVGAESASAVPTPASKTAVAKPAISAPSNKTAIAKPGIDAPSNLSAEAKAAISNPQDIAAQNYGTNLFTYSEQLDNADWGKTEASITPNVAVAPDGTTTADRLTDTAALSFHRIFQPIAANSGVSVAVSVFAKAESITELTFRSDITGGIMSSEALFDLTNGTVTGGDSSSIQPMGNGWYRCSVVYQTTSTVVIPQILMSKGGSRFYAGTGESLLLWGSQAEEAGSTNQYVKTEGTPITVANSVDKPEAVTAESPSSIAIPSAKTAQPQASIAAPSTLTANPATAVTPPFPLNHARILYENVLQGYNSITDTGPTGTAINAIKPNTWERWKFSTAANTLIVDFSTAVDFDTVCIASHNLSNAGATIAVYYEPEPGGVFLELGTKTPTNNEPICFYSETLLDALTIEIRITGASGVPQIGYVSAGESLQMQRPFFNGHIPITDGDVTEYYSNRTESGEIIGQQIRRQGYQTSADWRYIDDTWYRTYFDPFKKAAKLTPFFFMWNLLEYPDDVGFCRISQDINSPMQNGFTTKRTISMTLLGAG